MKNISQNGIDLIKSFEGCQLQAYKAVPTEQFFTIGYGHYSSDVSYGMTITQEQAEEMLVNDLQRFVGYVNKDVSLELNQNQFDALVSFCYNCGEGNLLDLCLGKTIQQIGENIVLYNKSSGNVLDGLTKRRIAEQTLFLEKDVLNLDDKVVDYILSILSYYYAQMNGNEDVQNYTHFVANELRKAVGRQEE